MRMEYSMDSHWLISEAIWDDIVLMRLDMWGDPKAGVLRFTGQYWQSVKRSAHTVELSYMQAQRHDLEENATVNALASLSVGVLNTKRYPRPRWKKIHVHMQNNVICQHSAHWVLSQARL